MRRLVGDHASVVVRLFEGGATARSPDSVRNTSCNSPTSLCLWNVVRMAPLVLRDNRSSLEIVIQILATLHDV